MPEEPEKRHGRGGLFVVAMLGTVFIVLLVLLLVASGKREEQSQETSASETLFVIPLKLRVRTEPSARAAVLTTIDQGQQVTVLEDRSAWVRVKLADGMEGWAERNALERSSAHDQRLARWAAIRKMPPMPGRVDETTALYAGPGIFYPPVGELSEGSRVKILTRDHDFYAVDIGSAIGYADVDTISLSTTGTQLQVEASNEPTTTAAPEVTETSTAEAPESGIAVQPPEVAESEPAHDEVYPVVPPGGTQPEFVDRVMPRYPTAARLAGVAGTVVLRGIIRRDGSIDHVEVLKDLPYGLGESARDAVEQWRFRPATLNGQPIDVYYSVTVNYSLR